MSRSRFRDMDMTENVRIDARPPSPEKAAGMRNLHHDTDGTVIGGVDRYGTPLGSRARRGAADGSSLGNPVTPGLDRNAEMNKQSAATPVPKASETTAAAPAGSQLLKDRQALHAEMKAAGPSGITPEMSARAKALGVKDSSFRRVASSLGAAAAAAPVVAKAAPAIPQVPVRPAMPVAALPAGQAKPIPAAVTPPPVAAPVTPPVASPRPPQVQVRPPVAVAPPVVQPPIIAAQSPILPVTPKVPAWRQTPVNLPNDPQKLQRQRGY